jgi:hypothetical protein
MSEAIEQLVAEIEALDLDGLRAFWRERFGAPPPLRSEPIMRQLVAWRVQAQVMGGLDIKMRKALARSGPVQAEGKHLGNGARLTRIWKGREVTGERIRDKIAASKAKGMWMGGMPPLGYDPPTDGTRTLKLAEAEADRVRHIFTRYLELESVHALQRDLEAHGIHSKLHITAKGRTIGGLPFSRGALFHLLRNRVYLGQITHKGEVHEGEHDAIVDAMIFDQVQTMLDAQVRRHRNKASTRKIKAPLTGKLFDPVGEPMSPTTSRGKSGGTYRYYVSASLQQGARPAGSDLVQRVSATEIEKVISEAVRLWEPTAGDAFAIVRSVRISERGLQVAVGKSHAASVVTRLAADETILDRSADMVTILLPIRFATRGSKQQIVPANSRPPQPDQVLISALRKAHVMLRTERGLPVMETAPDSPYDRNILRLAFLAPDIQRAILAGRQPLQLNLENLKKTAIPLAWSQQRKVLGFGEVGIPCSDDQIP